MYHCLIGVDHFYLYDNTGSVWQDLGNNINVNGKTKQGVDIRTLTQQWSDADIDKMLKQILANFSGQYTLIPWHPRDHAGGDIVYGQDKALWDFYYHYRFDNKWTCHIDVDEFLFSPKDIDLKKILSDAYDQEYSSIVIHQKKFLDRFEHKRDDTFSFVTDIAQCIGELQERWAPKNIVQPTHVNLYNLFWPGVIHAIPVREGHKTKYIEDMSELRFNHYNLNASAFEFIHNYTQKNYQLDAEDYGMKRYAEKIHARSYVMDKQRQDQSERRSLRFSPNVRGALSQTDDGREKHFVFVCGVRGSGTSVLHSLLQRHPDISGFVHTGAPEDEGQYLQSVYPSTRLLGDPDSLIFQPESCMDETHPLATATNAQRLYAEWSAYWDLSKSHLLERSLSHILRMRFLQALFPTVSFIILLRHPLSVAYATLPGCSAGLQPLIEHTLRCYEQMLEDKAYLSRLLVCRYEDMVADPQQLLQRIHTFLGLPVHTSSMPVNRHRDTKYLQQWRHDLDRLGTDSAHFLRIMRDTFADRLGAFGYGLEQPEYINRVEWIETD